jgi:cellulose synthase/poly-beta-1,6-N-acetylglucosamine synthase-like glycosyltransferase
MTLAIGVVCFSAILWSWFGYPVALWLVARRRTSKPQPEAAMVDVSVIVVAYNERAYIGRKLENLIAISWPGKRKEILVISDCSNDDTDEIVRTFSSRGVRLIAAPSRVGKDRCQEIGVAHTRASIVVFTDTTTELETSSLVAIVRAFRDPNVGCVSGVDIPETEGNRIEAEGLYVRYEMMVRRSESALGRLIGASGCFFAVRRTICDPWPRDLSSDFALPLIARLQGLQVVAEENALCRYRVIESPLAEFERKVRTIVHGMLVLLAYFPRIFRTGQFVLAFQVISHKLLRWSLPMLCLGLLVSSARLSHESRFWSLVLLTQVLLWGGALLGFGFPGLRRFSVFRALLYVALVNASVVVAGLRLLRGARHSTWEPTRR